jgi:predicted molibdopterin-dependent oxidoreductase YjgC
MFRRLDPPETETVTVTVEDRTVSVPAGDSVAAAVYAAGFDHTRRSAVSGGPRGPYCMMGVCFECLVEIDGVANQQACMTPVRQGMHIRRQTGPREIES